MYGATGIGKLVPPMDETKFQAANNLVRKKREQKLILIGRVQPPYGKATEPLALKLSAASPSP